MAKLPNGVAFPVIVDAKEQLNWANPISPSIQLTSILQL
jgi:hypothetical protein